MMRFKKQEDSYLDTVSGLEWSLENYGPMSWSDAVRLPQGLGSVWRLPNIKEIFTLVDFRKISPATELPGGISSYYWSSSIYEGEHDYAWAVYLVSGYVGPMHKTGHNYVRFVRGTDQSNWREV